MMRINDDDVTCADCERLHPQCTCSPQRPWSGNGGSTSAAPMPRFVAVQPLTPLRRLWRWLTTPMARGTPCDHIVDLEAGRCACGRFIVNPALQTATTAPSVVGKVEEIDLVVAAATAQAAALVGRNPSPILLHIAVADFMRPRPPRLPEIKIKP